MPTPLQDQRQDETALTNYQGAVPVPIGQGNSNTVPSAYLNIGQQAKQIAATPPQIAPPTSKEIHSQMWKGSMMVGLLAGIATGNPAAGIIGGSWAAIGIHDYGNSLQQRGGYIDQLKKEGYTMPAILKWYEDGDAKELDKERSDMTTRARMEMQDKQFTERQAQQDRQFNIRESQQAQQFNQRMGMEGARLNQMISHQNAMERLQGQRIDQAGKNAQVMSLAHLNPLMTSLQRPHSTELRTMQQKQAYLDQLTTDIDLIRSGNPAGRNALLTAIAGVDNPNISPREGAIERIVEMGGIDENLKNWLAGKTSGTFTPEMMDQVEGFAKAHQKDTDMSRQRIHNEVYAAAKPFTNPDTAAAMADVVAGGGIIDQDSPGISTTDQHAEHATSQVNSATDAAKGKPAPVPDDIQSLMNKYGG